MEDNKLPFKFSLFNFSWMSSSLQSIYIFKISSRRNVRHQSLFFITLLSVFRCILNCQLYKTSKYFAFQSFAEILCNLFLLYLSFFIFFGIWFTVNSRLLLLSNHDHKLVVFCSNSSFWKLKHTFLSDKEDIVCWHLIWLPIIINVRSPSLTN